MKDLQFTQLKIKKEHQKSITVLSQTIQDNRSFFYEAGNLLALNKEIFFKTICLLYPELKDYEFSINHETSTISIFGKKIL